MTLFVVGLILMLIRVIQKWRHTFILRWVYKFCFYVKRLLVCCGKVLPLNTVTSFLTKPTWMHDFPFNFFWPNTFSGDLCQSYETISFVMLRQNLSFLILTKSQIFWFIQICSFSYFQDLYFSWEYVAIFFLRYIFIN